MRVMIVRRLLMLAAWFCAGGCAHVSNHNSLASQFVSRDQVERISTAVPFPRGLQIIDGKLYVLARGRVRESGGVDAGIDDKAGTIYQVDPTIAEPVSSEISQPVRNNGIVFAAPTSPPFRLFNRTRMPATTDRETDRPYCSLRYDPISRNFFICAFSGIDKAYDAIGGNFSKNTADAILRFDSRTRRWHDVERHNIEAGGNYPHHDPAVADPPHGWLSGPDNCLVVGNWLYAVSKENSVLVRYDLSKIAADPDAPPPKSHWVLGDTIQMKGMGRQRHTGHSMLAVHGDYLYVGYRTSSTIIRLKLDRDGLPLAPMRGELVARFDEYDPKTRQSANLTDMVFDKDGELYVMSAQPSRIYRFRPDPSNVFDARNGAAPPWADMAAITGNPKMKSENLLVDDSGRVYLTSGDAYDFQNGAGGTIYRINPRPDPFARRPDFPKSDPLLESSHPLFLSLEPGP